jgi:hypothetical protein
MATSDEPALEVLFPRLASSHYEITSPPTRDYNCVAWAAGYDDVPWDHTSVPYTYWPRRVPRDGSVDSLVILFAGLGYARCADGRMEAGYEKVALYGRANNAWTHVARQTDDGRWTSKLGGREDICHDSPQDLVGEDYGDVVCFLRRPRTSP